LPHPSLTPMPRSLAQHSTVTSPSSSMGSMPGPLPLSASESTSRFFLSIGRKASVKRNDLLRRRRHLPRRRGLPHNRNPSSCPQAHSGIVLDTEQQENLELQDDELTLVRGKPDFQPDDRPPDTGCRRGTLATFAPKKYGCKVTGIALSKNQKDQDHRWRSQPSPHSLHGFPAKGFLHQDRYSRVAEVNICAIPLYAVWSGYTCSWEVSGR